MLHTKFRENRPTGSGEKDFRRVFTIYWHGAVTLWNLRQSFALKFLKWSISQQLHIRKHSYLDHSYPGWLAFTPRPKTQGPCPWVGLEVKI